MNQPKDIPDLYAYVGMDELGSGKIGLKQGLVPAGFIPLVATDYDVQKLKNLKDQMQLQARHYGTRISLVRFKAEEVVWETK